MLYWRSVQLREECKRSGCQYAGGQKLSFSSPHLAWNSSSGVRDTVAVCPPLLSSVCFLSISPKFRGQSIIPNESAQVLFMCSTEGSDVHIGLSSSQ